MPRLELHEILLLNLEFDLPQYTRVHINRATAFELLKAGTGQDFGDDLEAWRKWLAENSLDYKRMYQSQLPEPNWKRLKNKPKKARK